MKDSHNPLAEVFGHCITDMSKRAKRYRKHKLCPFNNRVPNCTKDKAKDPLGVCSIYDNAKPVITCPVRFREDWIISEDAAEFFFPENTSWTSLTEVRLNDAHDKSAGNIDLVLVAYDSEGNVTDFGALEIQAVYISGNIRNPFQSYMRMPDSYIETGWQGQEYYPRPDFLSSSRKRLAPQLLYKGGILNSWSKKCAVALNSAFYETLPKLTLADKEKADIAWLIYDLEKSTSDEYEKYKLKKTKTIYTKFEPALKAITRPAPGKLDSFMQVLQTRLDNKLETEPINRTIESPF